ncbi:hypothetical protein [Streptomyces scopuliridis]|uniref:hypothetical protein n=1 Tax=Streptomyces scopuliridis TaxID=452529 RepID=UPI0034429EEC
MTRAVVEVGARVRYSGRVWTVAVLEGARATLLTDEGAAAVVLLLPYLFSHPSFEVEGGSAPGRVPPFGLLETLPTEVRERALAWQRHVREVETGFPNAAGQGVPREQFDPATRNLVQREEAKARELTAAGWAVSVATVRRMPGLQRRHVPARLRQHLPRLVGHLQPGPRPWLHTALGPRHFQPPPHRPHIHPADLGARTHMCRRQRPGRIELPQPRNQHRPGHPQPRRDLTPRARLAHPTPFRRGHRHPSRCSRAAVERIRSAVPATAARGGVYRSMTATPTPGTAPCQ